jgi:putative redox protein
MVKIQANYEGELHCVATHGPSKVTLPTDAPVDNLGRGASFSPTDLVATALGTCMLTTMGIVAQRNGWNIAGAAIEVEKGMVADPLRRIGSLTVVLRIPGDFDATARKTLEQTALTCPVTRCLHPDVSIPVRFEWSATAAKR